MTKTTQKVFAIFTICFLINVLHSNAQRLGKLWGMAPQGGNSNNGVIFNYDSLRGYDSIVYAPVTNNNGDINNPVYGGLVLAPDGNFYGMGPENSSFGGIFKYTPGGVETIVWNFQGFMDGNSPTGSLIVGRDGNLYGMTSQGGNGSANNNSGVIFEWNIAKDTETVLYQFGDSADDGINPMGNLMQASDGNFYGLTENGGANGAGIIFEWNPVTAKETVLYSFSNSGTDGTNPQGSLIQAADGNLYGMTGQGGAGNGTIFEWNMTTGTESVLYSFLASNDGATPLGTLLQNTDGNFYGVTTAGGTASSGTIFEWNTTTQAESVLYSFAGGTTDGGNPEGVALLKAADGNLYGTTSAGGANGNGTIFEWNTTSLSESVVYNFGQAYHDGANPGGSLIQTTDGSLYGMATNGGTTAGYGVIFKSTTSGTETPVYAFNQGGPGFTPNGNLIQANDGNLYGMTVAGGLWNQGIIFKSTPDGQITKLYDFGSMPNDGNAPNGSLIQATDGNLYGMTFYGGAYGYGAIIEWNMATSTETVLYSFGGVSTDGSNPNGSLLQASDGNFYGFTTNGGNVTFAPLIGRIGGTFFEWNPTSATETVLHDFTISDRGFNPSGSLIQASDGNLYGLAGGPWGEIFEWNMTQQIAGQVYGFQESSSQDAGNPMGDLIQAKDGNLYGMSYSGGQSGGAGAIFEWDIATQTESVIFNFQNTGPGGANPTGSLIQASDSNFYGMTQSGGTQGDGVVFEYNTHTDTAINLVSFNNTNGQNPVNSLLEVFSSPISVSCSAAGTLVANTRGGGTGGYTYSWSTGASTSTINVTTPGRYAVAVTNGAGLTIHDTIMYTGNEKIFNVSTSGPLFTCDSSTTNLSAIPSGGAGTVSYSWLPDTLTGASPAVTPAITTTFTVTAEDGYGCMANATQKVSANHSNVSSYTQTSCEVYKLNDKIYDSTGIYTQLLTNKNGCDSTLTLHLTITQPTSSTLTAASCNTYVLNGVSYTASGTYTQVIPNKLGCDSNITLNLTIVPGAPGSLTETACNGYNLNGTIYTASGTYTQNLTNKAGCDSTLTLHLTVNQGSADTITKVTCTPYTLNGSTYNSSGTFIQNLSNKAGCDSTISLHLTVNPAPVIGIIGNSIGGIGTPDTLTANGGISYVWSDGSTNDTAVVIPSGNETYTVTGTDANSCTGTATFTVTVGPTGLNGLSASGSVSLYPNPTLNTLTLAFTTQGNAQVSQISITDIMGKELISEQATISNGKIVTIDVSTLAQGMYFVRITSGSETHTSKFIKE